LLPAFPPKRSETPEPEHPKKGDPNVALREFIHEQIQLREWNYAEFAKAVDTDGSVVRRWIRDRRPEPAMGWQMAERLGADLEDLMRTGGHLPP
jgi:hypothetical protein